MFEVRGSGFLGIGLQSFEKRRILPPNPEPRTPNPEPRTPNPEPRTPMSDFRTIRISDPRFEYDGLRIVTVKSKMLGGRGDISLYAPDTCPSNAPVVILLHGVYGSHWSWSLGGGAHKTAARLIEAGEIKPMVLAMPSDGLWGDGSGYLPHASANYERWIVDEVPAAVREVVDAVSEKSPLFIGGLSMGGFGALRLGGKYARRFSGISAHSAITHFDQLSEFVEEPLEAYQSVSDDHSAAEALISNRATLPPLRFDCGRDDSLLEANRALHKSLEDAGVLHEYEEFAGGHAWAYWEMHVADTLRFFDKVV